LAHVEMSTYAPATKCAHAFDDRLPCVTGAPCWILFGGIISPVSRDCDCMRELLSALLGRLSESGLGTETGEFMHDIR